MLTAFRAPLLILAFVLAAVLPARAQCLDWADEFGTTAFDGEGLALATFDDGSGLALYFGGSFTSACGQPISGVARWDGSTWTALGAGIPGVVSALCVFDDGNGPALYAGGSFAFAGASAASNVARWNGTAWSALSSGTNGAVQALSVFDDGAGPALYAAGTFTQAGATTASNIARWNGAAWSALGAGVNGTIYALCVFDDGTGPMLWAGGQFASAGGAPASRIARWDGATWSAADVGFDNLVLDLHVHDDGGGARLYAGGFFVLSGAQSVQRVARWTGSGWVQVGTGQLSDVGALATFDAGAGPRLYAGSANGLVSEWNGSAWTIVTTAFNVHAMLPFAVGGPARLFVAGGFTAIGGITSPVIASYDGVGWSSTCANRGLDAFASDLETFDDGHGAKLYVAGRFQHAGGVPARWIASYDGAAWSALGAGLGGTTSTEPVRDLLAYDDGSGAALYVVGDFTLAGGQPANHVARWNGTNWSAVGAGLPATGTALVAFDDGTGTKLYAGTNAASPNPLGVAGVYAWNGTTWSALATTNFLSGGITKLVVHDEGAGSHLYAFGTMYLVPPSFTQHAVRLDGSTWTVIEDTFCCGSSDALSYVNNGQRVLADVGWFIGPPAGFHMLREWNGTSWIQRATMPPGGGTASGFASCATLFDDRGGDGEGLYLGGYFAGVDGVPAQSIARWNGTSWSALGSGVSAPSFGTVYALQAYDDGRDGGPDLFAAGSFTTAGGRSSSHIARWRGCPAGNRFCTGDGLDPVVTNACPCGNTGAPGRGCAWSNNPAGAELVAVGATNPDTMKLVATGMSLSATGTTFLKGDAQLANGVVFGDGVRCVDGSLIRLAIKTNVNGAARFPEPGNLSLSVRGATPPGSGAVAYYQVYYRTASATFCPPATFNVTNGWRIVW